MSAISEGNFGGAAGAMNLWAVFLTGLTVGGLSCMAVQGGFLASVISTRSGVGGSRLSALWAILILFSAPETAPKMLLLI